MRLKRSRDSRSVDNFQRTREEMQVESQQNHLSIQSSLTTQVHHREEEEEDDEDLQVSLEISLVC